MKYFTTCLIFLLIGMVTRPAFSQDKFQGKLVDAEDGFPVPFAFIYANETHEISDVKGEFNYRAGQRVTIKHPLYEVKKTTLAAHDSLLTIQLVQKLDLAEQLKKMPSGIKILKEFHKNMHRNNPRNIRAFETINNNTARIYKKSLHEETDPWELETEYELIEKFRYIFPKKSFHKTLISRFTDGDTSKITYLQFNLENISPYNQFFKQRELRFSSPLHPNEQNHYHYYLIDSTIVEKETIYALYTVPKRTKRFLGVVGIFYISKMNHGIRAFMYYTQPEKASKSFATAFFRQINDSILFQQNIYTEVILPHLPKFNEIVRVKSETRFSRPSLDLQDNTKNKWVDLVLFDRYDSARANESWTMDPVKKTDDDVLEYVKKDTTNQKYVRKKWTEILGNLYEGKAAIRLPLFDLKNVISINKFETLRLGVGLQSHRELSDLFTLGGYFGYGFEDQQIKYGGNFGFYLGAKRKTLLSYTYLKDLREPGRNTYFEQKPNYLRNFFAREMDNVTSHEISIASQPEELFSIQGQLKAFELSPNYVYSFTPVNSTEAQSDNFNFTTASVKFKIGIPFEHEIGARELLYRHRIMFPTLYLNIERGFDDVFRGDYKFWRFNGMISTYWNFPGTSYFETILDAGVMTINQPYQVMFNGNGSDASFVGIIVKHSFQTMKLYQYATDRYINAFLKYSFPLLNLKNSNFKPELAVALNMGWGIIRGDPSIHQSNDIAVNEYGKGYYEVGLMVNKLVKIKLLNFLYGGFGLGGFYGYGLDLKESRFAMRLTYNIGTL